MHQAILNKNQFILFIVTFFILRSVTLFALDKMQWKPIAPPSDKDLLFLSAQSHDDFWIYSRSSGKIFHYLQGEWMEKELPAVPDDVTNKDIYYVLLTSEGLICYTIDNAYHTDFYYFDGSRWIKFDKRIEVPLRYHYRVSVSEVWFYGDWGRLVHFENGNFEEIETPIQNHLLSLNIDAQGHIWIGTRNEGIFSYNGQQFTHFPSDAETNFDIMAINTDRNGRIDYFTNHGDCFYLNDTLFTEYFNLRESNTRIEYNTDIFGYTIAYNVFESGLFYQITGGQWKQMELPVNYLIQDVIVIDPNTVLFYGSTGLILAGRSNQNTFFSENAGKFSVGGSIYDHSEACSFIDLNNDSYYDLYVVNRGYYQRNRLYLNHDHRDFLEHRALRTDALRKSSDHFVFGDVNNDARMDFISVDSNNKIDIFLQINDFQFIEIDSIINYTNHSIYAIDLADVDRDNDLDIILTSYFTNGRNIGTVSVLENRRFGTRFVEDTTFSNDFRGWNNSIVFCDFDNNAHRDIYLNRRWQSDKILLNAENHWDIIDSIQTEDQMSIISIAVDFDNDGDLDIFNGHKDKTSLSLYQNNGDGNFKNISEDFNFAQCLNNKTNSFICSGDFNNDGFIDLFLSPLGSERNFLLLNDSANTFTDVTEEYGLLRPTVNGAICSDVDEDGDLDIFGIRNENNLLWENRTDNQNYLIVKLQGHGSSLYGRNAKVWVYDSGHLNEKQYLRGYREIGADQPGWNLHSSLMAHFGLKSHKSYDLRIRFINEKEKIITGITAGQSITVKQYGELILFLKKLPGFIAVTLYQSTFYYYLMTIIIGMALIINGIRFGRLKYQWDYKVSIWLLAFTTSIFWITLYLFHGEHWMMSYLLALLIIVIIFSVSFFMSISIKHREHFLHASQRRAVLLKNLLVFSHGEWASSSLNSLILLCKNISSLEEISERYYGQLIDRLNRFKQLVIPKLERIFDLSQNIGLDDDLIEEFRLSLEFFHDNLIHLTKTDHSIDAKLCTDSVPYLEKVKAIVKKIAQQIFQYYSCDALTVISALTNDYENISATENIELVRKRDSSESYNVLIPDQDLADVIDNCLKNSIKVLQRRSGGKTIEINIYHFPPKIRIDISDNGPGMSESDVDKIFESGFSGTGGTGMGLFQSRQVLEKYGGRINVSDTKQDQGTTMSIELLKGVKA